MHPPLSGLQRGRLAEGWVPKIAGGLPLGEGT